MIKMDEFLQKVVVNDTETTGVDEDDDIIEFSASFPMSAQDGIDDIINYTNRYKPLKPVPAIASSVHFITDDDLVDCGSYKDDIENIDALFTSREFYVGHNVDFDRDMYIQNHRKSTGIVPEYMIDNTKWICTLRLAKKLFAEDMEYENFKLSYLWFKYGLNKTVDRPINAHAAKDDVYMCFKVLVKLVEICIERGVIDPNQDIGEQIIAFCNKPYRYQIMPIGKHKGEKMKDVPLNYLNWMITNSDILNADLPNYDVDLAYTIECEYAERSN